MKSVRKRKATGLKDELRSQVKGVLLLALAAFCYAGIWQSEKTGELGLFLHNLLRTLAGETAVVIPFLIGVYSLKLLIPEAFLNIKKRLTGVLILLFLFMISAHLQLMIEQIELLPGQNFYRVSLELGMQHQGGGIIGALLAIILFFSFRDLGSYIVIVALAIISLLLITNVSVRQMLTAFKKVVLLLFKLLKATGRFLRETYHILIAGAAEETAGEKKGEIAAGRDNGKSFSSAEEDEQSKQPDGKEETRPAFMVSPQEGGLSHLEAPSYQKERHLTLAQPEDNPISSAATGQNRREPLYTTGSPYILPPLDLLVKPSRLSDSQQVKGIRERARLLENTLLSFGVKAKVIHVETGPTVTRFEVQPEAGVKVSRIINLSDDLALNLAAPLVRIEAPIPGKAALGIEVPNKNISLVYLREVLESSSFQDQYSCLTVGLGKDITGVPVVADLARMPHLLIAGATGSGKSVCLNTIIASILYKATPQQVRLLMIDPKVVELSSYNGIPQLLLPVVTEPKKAALALRNMVREMGRRYELFAHEGVREITAFNELVLSRNGDGETLPYIVVVIDELADLMIVAPGDVEDAIARLAQMSRAAGIHLVIATQRPSVDVLTGVIKANITSRIALTVSSQVDSRTILDMAGAEKLLGRGDMLYYPVGSVKPIRVQGAYISEREINELTGFIREQGKAEYEENLLPQEFEDNAGLDELFADAIELVARTGQASISLLQRRFRIGYTRAARLIDELERRGIVGQFEGSKPREVIITPEQAARLYEEFK